MKKTFLGILTFGMLTIFNFSYAQVGGNITRNIATVYNSSEDFLQSEGQTCKVATDGCNTVQILNGELGAMTMMYCEDIYGENGQEQWSCKEDILVGGDKDKYGCIGSAGYFWSGLKNECVRTWELGKEIYQINYENYIIENISKLSIKKPVLGGKWYVTNIEWLKNNNLKIYYEDGHIDNILIKNISDLEISQDEDLFCTMQYEPVCGINGKTYGNSCSAGKNKILYKGECDDFVDVTLYQKLENKFTKDVLNKITTNKLLNGIKNADKQIKMVKMSRIAQWVQKERITKLVFVKNLILEQLNLR